MEELQAEHDKFTQELKYEFDECQRMVQHGVPMIIDDVGVIKEKVVWLFECKSLLSVAQAVAQENTLDMNDTTDQLENLFMIEIVAKDAMFSMTTYKNADYLRHIQRCGWQLDQNA